jgi:hypothetical protein
MGLDMYAFAVEANDGNEDSKISESADKTEIAYWRKFNALHGWMEGLYRTRGGLDEFNCIPVRLTEADLNQLEFDLNNNRLKPVEGFFFGAQDIYPEDIEATKKFIEDAREQIADGLEVYYDSWW